MTVVEVKKWCGVQVVGHSKDVKILGLFGAYHYSGQFLLHKCKTIYTAALYYPDYTPAPEDLVE